MKTLKQPQLGESIVALRQKKKLTQEELVELCNINVRTLQRIEAGEVTPRDYTMRLILSALDYDFDQVETSIHKKQAINRLRIGWIAGIVYFVLGLVEAGVDFSRFESDLPFYFPMLYSSVKIIVVASYAYMMIGFAEVGKHFSSSLLKISAYLMLGSMFVIEFYDIISIFSGISEEEFMMIKGGEAVAFGGIDIIFGIALFRLGNELGTSARVAGMLEILVGACFLVLILAPIGLIMLIPATIVEIVVLYKCYEMLNTDR